MQLTLNSICEWLGLVCPKDALMTGVSIDTRTLKPGHLFVAFRGARVDGHMFIPDAVEKGAAAILCIEAPKNCAVPVLIYPDLEDALTRMARAYRAQFKGKVVALTGSNGKTTVKEMLKAILLPNVFGTPGNWNNQLGVPLSILQLNASHQYAVFELGANHTGEIAHTVSIVKPDVALINNIGPAHIGLFGSMDAIASAKGEIYGGLSETGVAVVNADDAYAKSWHQVIGQKQKLCFSSIDKTADIYAKDIQCISSEHTIFQLVKGDDTCEINLSVPGKHQVQNALAAAACATALGVDLSNIKKGLSTFTGVSGRLMAKKTVSGSLILDDTYNANLNSVMTGIRLLATHTGKRILVFGDMGELGDYSKAHHEAVGVAAKKEGIDQLFTCGIASEAATEAFGEHAQHFMNQEELLHVLRKILNSKTTVLIKGSRSSAMDQIVAALLQ